MSGHLIRFAHSMVAHFNQRMHSQIFSTFGGLRDGDLRRNLELLKLVYYFNEVRKVHETGSGFAANTIGRTNRETNTY